MSPKKFNWLWSGLVTDSSFRIKASPQKRIRSQLLPLLTAPVLLATNPPQKCLRYCFRTVDGWSRTESLLFLRLLSASASSSLCPTLSCCPFLWPEEDSPTVIHWLSRLLTLTATPPLMSSAPSGPERSRATATAMWRARTRTKRPTALEEPWNTSPTRADSTPMWWPMSPEPSAALPPMPSTELKTKERSIDIAKV